MLKITLVAAGNKMPSWVNDAVKEFSKRLQDSINIQIIEIPLLRRGKSADLARIIDKEAALIRQAIPPNARLIALDVQGRAFSSETLAQHIAQLQQITSHLCLVIGGPEGLAAEVLARCHETWSLSPLTLPHPIARIVLIEALYRAWTIIHNHPYHKS